MAQTFALAASLLAASVSAQQIGAYTPEVHPMLPSMRCTLAGGCKPANTSIVLDSQYRWTHNVGGYTNCKSGTFNATFCPDAESCSKNCALEGVDYGGYGVKVNGDAVTLNLFVDKGMGPQMSSPRVYLYDEAAKGYDMFSLLNQEIAFDVDTSKVPCGVNGALYLSAMEANGGQSDINPAGSNYGTGYCDAQCPVNDFINGRANLDGKGACCNEMDLWEANSAANALTPHPCNITGVYECTGALCGNGNNKYQSVCDKDGCGYNPYSMGQHDFYGPNKTVDTNRKFTVVTQFLASNTTGDLSEIRRVYVQDGRVIQNAVLTIPNLAPTNSLTDTSCQAAHDVLGGVNAFKTQGGMKQMGDALKRGMVLALSIWDDAGGYMQWLDSTTGSDPTAPGAAHGPCPTSSGRPADIVANYPDAAVTWSNIKSGEIGSTFAGATMKTRRYNRPSLRQN